MGTYYLPSTVPGIWDRPVNKTRSMSSNSLKYSGERQTTKISIITKLSRMFKSGKC